MSCVFLVSTGVTSGDCNFQNMRSRVEGQRDNMIFLGKRHSRGFGTTQLLIAKNITVVWSLKIMETNEAVHVDESGEHDNDVEGK